MPAPCGVTRPPMKIRGNVVTVVATARKWRGRLYDRRIIERLTRYERKPGLLAASPHQPAVRLGVGLDCPTSGAALFPARRVAVDRSPVRPEAAAWCS